VHFDFGQMSLTLLLLLPLIASLVIAFVSEKASRNIAIVASALMFVLSLAILLGFQPALSGMQFDYKAIWFNTPLPVQYHVGVDGINLSLAILTTFIVLMAVLASSSITTRPKLYYSLVMLLTMSLLGVFLSLDLLQFFVFYELELIPMYFLIAVWGGPNRSYAAMKFLLYTFLGGVFMLAGLIYLYSQLSVFDPNTSFDMITLAQRCPLLPKIMQVVAFLGFFIAFVIKLPSFPVHTWLPDAHVEAPTPISMILAGLLLKMGSYGLVRICLGFFPGVIAEYGNWILLLGAFNIVWAAMACLVQRDMKRIIAFSSVSHMGFVLMGIACISSLALQGAVFQMISHGLISALLFFLVGAVYERCHTRDLGEIGGGLAKQMPVLFYFWMFASLANLGLPGLSGFVAETAIYYGSFTSLLVSSAHSVIGKPAVIFATLGVVLTAAYMLWLLKRLFFGPEQEKWAGHLHDARPTEKLIAWSLSVIVIALGVFPLLLTEQYNYTTEALTKLVAGQFSALTTNVPPKALK
jgi:NADH-quinone oxidoreductase subunit M